MLPICYWSRKKEFILYAWHYSSSLTFSLSFAKPPMHLHAPAILASSFWYPNHVGSFRVSHSSSINIILVIPKSRECIIDEFWLRNVTIWTLITLMSLWPTSVANTTFDLSCWGLALVFAHSLLLDLEACWRGLIALDMHLRHHCCQNRSNRFPKPGRPVWYRQHPGYLWTITNEMSMLLAFVAYPSP
jgi:hypothetical protein